jgi:toxin ParE1/3/4
MAYRVEITPRAERDLVSLYNYIKAGDSPQAQTWYFGLKDVILSLRELPDRNPITPENKRLRQLLHGHKPHVYRVIYRVRSKPRVVEILHIRHGARRRFESVDLS